MEKDDQKWSILGQSFGGFCAITYLSFHSEGLKEVFLTGGLAPLISAPDECYKATISTCVASFPEELLLIFEHRTSNQKKRGLLYKVHQRCRKSAFCFLQQFPSREKSRMLTLSI